MELTVTLLMLFLVIIVQLAKPPHMKEVAALTSAKGVCNFFSSFHFVFEILQT